MSGKSIYSSSIKIINKFNEFIDDDINILIVGMIGVGKSTFVNMVANYIKYKSLDDALETATLDQIYIINSKIEINDENKIHKFTLGGVDDYKIGSSVTKYSLQYRIKLPDGKNLCLIDVPGVGGQSALEDKKHFQNILHEISLMKKLNAICILMRPDETRATILFKYCLNQLLEHLHSSAKDNIFFCFTHTRATMYKPGSTIAILEDHLKKMKDQSDIEINSKGKTFCFDNESLNYLAVKLYSATTGVETSFSEECEIDFGRSWDRSSREFDRLLKEISKVKPHVIEDTIYMNNARIMISYLTQTMSTCISNVNTNIKLMEEYDTIKTAIADFSVFLWHHSLIKFNCYYETYIKMQIEQLEYSENSQELIQELKENLSKYKASVQKLKQNVQNNKATMKTQKEIYEAFNKLLNLPNVGYIIKNQIRLAQSSLYKINAVEIDL
ncbi:hypothetical protein ACTFIW_002071 [Dictyostelium discoideum]